MDIFNGKRLLAAAASVMLAFGIVGCNASEGSASGSTSSSVSGSASGSASGSTSGSVSGSTSSSVSSSANSSASGSTSSSMSSSTGASISGSISSDVEEANALAQKARADFEEFLSEAKEEGHGAGSDTFNVDTIVLDVNNGKWSCEVDDAERYNLTDFSKYAEEKLCGEFSKKYKGVG